MRKFTAAVLAAAAAISMLCGCGNDVKEREPMPTIETAPKHTYKTVTENTELFMYSTAPESVQPKMGSETALYDYVFPEADTAAVYADEDIIVPDTAAGQIISADTAMRDVETAAVRNDIPEADTQAVGTEIAADNNMAYEYISADTADGNADR